MDAYAAYRGYGSKISKPIPEQWMLAPQSATRECDLSGDNESTPRRRRQSPPSVIALCSGRLSHGSHPGYFPVLIRWTTRTNAPGWALSVTDRRCCGSVDVQDSVKGVTIQRRECSCDESMTFKVVAEGGIAPASALQDLSWILCQEDFILLLILIHMEKSVPIFLMNMTTHLLRGDRVPVDFRIYFLYYGEYRC